MRAAMRVPWEQASRGGTMVPTKYWALARHVAREEEDGDDGREPADSAGEAEECRRPEAAGPVQPCQRRVPIWAAALAAAALALCALTAAWRRNRVPELGPRRWLAQVKSEADPGRCGMVEIGVNYFIDEDEAGWNGYGLDHVPSPDMCCAMCQGVPRCRSWVWVQDAGLSGCPSQCWLKGGLPVRREPHQGFVSGLPPPRPSLVAIRALTVAAKPEKESAGSIFCFSLMQRGSYEEELLRFQYAENASIFVCDAWAVYSNRTIRAGHHGQPFPTTAVGANLSVDMGGAYNTALNSLVFIAVWRKVIEERRHHKHDWLVKVDPDAVFFSDRLREVLVDHKGVGYVSNCKYGLHGPIEVLSRAAVHTLEKDYERSRHGSRPERCVRGVDITVWGEDYFLDQCLKGVHGVSHSLDDRLMCESHCDCPDWYWCKHATKWVTFHPFKRVDWYRQCMANALNGALLPAPDLELVTARFVPPPQLHDASQKPGALGFPLLFG